MGLTHVPVGTEETASKRTNTVWAAGGTAVESLGRFLLLVILTKGLGAEQYGVWSLAMVVVYSCVAVFSLQLPQTMVRFLAGTEDRDRISSVVLGVFGWVLIGTLVGALILAAIAGWLGDQFVPETPRVAGHAFLAGSAVVVASGLEIAGWEFYRTFLRFRRYTIQLSVRVVCDVIVLLSLVLSGFGLVSLLVSMSLTRLGSFAVTFWFILRRYPGTFARPDSSVLRDYVGYSIPFVFVSLFTWFLKLSDRYVVAFYRPTSEVGAYSASYDLAMFMMLIIVPLRRTLYPGLSAAWNMKRRREVSDLFRNAFRYFTLLAFPAVLMLPAVSAEVMRLLTEDGFVSLGALVLPTVAVGILFFGFHAVAAYALMLEERVKALAVLVTGSAVLNLALNLLLVPTSLGALGAAISTVASFCVLFLGTVAVSGRRIEFGVDWPFTLKALFASSIGAAILAWINISGMVTLLGGVLLAGSLYLVTMYLLGALSVREIRFLLLGRS